MLASLQLLAMVVDQEKPVPAPGDVADDGPVPLNLDRDSLMRPVARHVPARDVVGAVQRRLDHADRRLDPVHPDVDSPQVGQGH